MNILLFVTAMILLLSSLTYARMQMYRNLSLLQNQFNQYMIYRERGKINVEAENWYKNSVATQKEGKTPQQKKRPGLSRLSWSAFVDPKKKEALSPAEYVQLKLLSQKLLFVLYHDQKFYQELEAKQPDFANALLESLSVADNEEQKLTRAADLGNLNLSDPNLNETLYKILQGTMTSNPQPIVEQESEPGEEEDEIQEPGKKEEIKSPLGYYSILDFITLQEATKVRVYLAARPLLLAIFDDPSQVHNLVEMRCSLYNQLVHNAISADAAEQTLRTQFLGQAHGFDETILDFSVSKTNPRNYE